MFFTPPRKFAAAQLTSGANGAAPARRGRGACAAYGPVAQGGSCDQAAARLLGEAAPRLGAERRGRSLPAATHHRPRVPLLAAAAGRSLCVLLSSPRIRLRPGRGGVAAASSQLPGHASSSMGATGRARWGSGGDGHAAAAAFEARRCRAHPPPAAGGPRWWRVSAADGGLSLRQLFAWCCLRAGRSCIRPSCVRHGEPSSASRSVCGPERPRRAPRLR